MRRLLGGCVALLIVVTLLGYGCHTRFFRAYGNLLLAPTGPLSFTAVPVSGTGNAANYSFAFNSLFFAGSTLTTSGNTEYLCYYDTANPPHPRFMTRNLSNNALTFYNPGLSAANSNDGTHDVCAIAFDKTGILHLVYGSHVEPLIYYRSNAVVNSDGTFLSSGFTSHTMTGGGAESTISFYSFVVHPTTGELYFQYQNEASPATRLYFYHYDTGSSTWGGAAGTITDTTTSPNTPGEMMNTDGCEMFLNSLPQWDSDSNLWWNWNLWCSTVDNIYDVKWNGSAFYTLRGAPVTLPIDANMAPDYTITGVTPLNGFAIHNGILYSTYVHLDGGSVYQMYVAETSSGSFVTHQLTSYGSSPPTTCGAGWPGTVSSTQCIVRGGVIVGNDGYVHVVFPDVWTTAPGVGVLDYKSNNNFASSTSSVLFSTYTPNFAFNYDPVRYGNGIGPVTFMRLDSDSAYGFTYSFSNPGSMTIYDWNLGPYNCPANYTLIAGGYCRTYLTDPNVTTFQVPSNWNSANNSIDVFGGGGGAADGAGGGAGGEHRQINNLTLTPSSNVGVHVGAAGVGGSGAGGDPGTAGGDTYFCNATTNCASIAGTAVQVGSKGGLGGGGGVAALGGGQTGNTGGVGGTSHPGGNGGFNGPGDGDGGGGSGGPGGTGGTGGSGNHNGGGASGGANGGGANGTTIAGNNGANGGASITTGNQTGQAGGLGSTSSSNPGGNGSQGSGGGGGFGDVTTSATAGGVGGTGAELDLLHGSGAGGGSAGFGDSVAKANGGDGGFYGGGGGSPSTSVVGGTRGNGGNGRGGAIAVRFHP